MFNIKNVKIISIISVLVLLVSCNTANANNEVSFSANQDVETTQQIIQDMNGSLDNMQSNETMKNNENKKKAKPFS